MKRILSPVLAALLALFAAPAAAAEPGLPFERFELENGLKVILHQDSTLPQVATVVWYRVGSKDEPPGRTGFAHLFEHLMFKGSAHIPDGLLDVLLEEGGGWSNAFTSSDMTVYFNVAASNFLETMLWIEGDRMAGLLEAFDQPKLDNQRDVVRNERRQVIENQPYGQSEVILRENLWPEGHGYHWPVIGNHEDLVAAQVADVEAFFRNYYVPGNATLVIAGDFEPARARELVQRYLGWIPARGEPRRPSYEAAPPLAGPVMLAQEDQVQVPRLYLAWRGPAVFTGDEPALALGARILGGGKSSRLHQRLVYEDRLAQDVEASYDPEVLGGQFTIVITAKPGADLGRLRHAAEEELVRLGALTPAPAEVERARNAHESDFLSQLESVLWRGIQLAAYEVLAGDADYLERDLARFRQADAEAVSRAVRTWLPLERKVDLTIRPASPSGEDR